MAERIFVGKVSALHGLVDDDCRHGTLMVLVGQEAPAQECESNGLRVSRSARCNFCGGNFPKSWLRPAFNPELRGRIVVSEKNVLAGSHRFNLRQGTHAIEQAIIE